MSESIKRAVADGLQAAYKRHMECLERRRTEDALRMADAVLDVETGRSEPESARPEAVDYAYSRGRIEGANGLHAELCRALETLFADKADAPLEDIVKSAPAAAPVIRDILVESAGTEQPS